jgi:hypothetical protein
MPTAFALRTSLSTLFCEGMINRKSLQTEQILYTDFTDKHGLTISVFIRKIRVQNLLLVPELADG